jgi:hypothetical protein
MEMNGCWWNEWGSRLLVFRRNLLRKIGKYSKNRLAVPQFD